MGYVRGGKEYRLLTPVQGEPVWVANRDQQFRAWWE